MAASYEKGYAEHYDLIYGDKDYEAECDFLEDIFRKYSPLGVKTILELGCGTGGHAVPLLKRGYRVAGVDRSPGMLAVANEKAQRLGLELSSKCMDIRQLQLGEDFDACICMFNVIGYVTEDRDVQSVLRGARTCVRQDCLFVFDCWNGLAVMRTLPSVRVKTIQQERKKTIRIARPELDAVNHLCYVHYSLLTVEDASVLDETEETHVVRYFFPREMAHYLEDSGFEVLAMCPFLDLGGKVDENTWNITVVARAVST